MSLAIVLICIDFDNSKDTIKMTRLTKAINKMLI